jgi:cellobiose phosphorylase
VVRHGHGYTVFEQVRGGLEQELTVGVALSDPVKLIRLRLCNRGKTARQLAVFYYAEWVLGKREAAGLHVITEEDGENCVLLTRNAYNADFGSAVAFAASGSAQSCSKTADRTEFLGRNRSVSAPAGLEQEELDTPRQGPPREGRKKPAAQARERVKEARSASEAEGNNRPGWRGRSRRHCLPRWCCGLPVPPCQVGLSAECQELSGRAGAGLDPCAALQVKVEVGPGEEQVVVFLLGAARRRRTGAHLPRAGRAAARGAGGAGLGRRLVLAGLLRRRHAAGFAHQ